MPIIAIDPGNVQSGYCVIDQKTLRPLEFGKIDNEELLKKLESAAEQGWRWAVIEMVASYGMSVGRDVFDTTVWIGRFYQMLSSRCPVRMMCRIEEKKHICSAPPSRKPSNGLNREPPIWGLRSNPPRTTPERCFPLWR